MANARRPPRRPDQIRGDDDLLAIADRFRSALDDLTALIDSRRREIAEEREGEHGDGGR